MKFIEPDSSFHVKADFTLSSTDSEVLSLLYGPLLKANALSLYHILLSYALVQGGYETMESLSMNYGMDTGTLLSAREKLEAVGLLETYRKEKKTGQNAVLYLFRLLPPATPRKFFDDILLSTALTSALTNKEMQRRKSYFKVNEAILSKDFDNVSVSFKDVYSLDEMENIHETNTAESVKTLEKNYKKQNQFSLAKVIEILKKDQYDFVSLDLPEENIVSYSVLYGLKEEECASFIEKNTTTDNLFSFDSFLNDIKTAKRFATSHVAKEKDDYVAKGRVGKLMKLFASLTPREYLAEKLGSEPPDYMLKEIVAIKKDIGLNDSVINVVLDYCFRKLNGEFNNTYIEKVCYSLAASKIENASDAMTYLNQRDYQQTSFTTKKSRQHKKKTLPENNDDDKSESDDSDISISDLRAELDI